MQAIEKYKIKAENILINVEILVDNNGRRVYHLNVPKLSIATKALLQEIKQELILKIAITTSEILDPKIIGKLKLEFKSKAGVLLKEKLPNLEESIKNFLVTILLNEMVGLGDIEFLLNDGQLEEIVITSATESLRVYHKKYGWLETDIKIDTEAQIQNFSNIIARRVGRQITTLNPLLDAHLLTGDRANAVLFPISTKGHTITIRKFARDPWTVTDFIQNKTCNSEVFALIWLGIQYEMNILISGGTASGKTSFLNVCMPFMPPNQRIISIEDTRELYLPEYLYWCPLTSRQPNPEGKGEVSMLDLLVNSLRMRPDRIILGEMRKKDQAQVLFEAMHTGHSVYATVHADTISETIKRLTNPPIEVPANLLNAVNLNVVMFRDRRRGFRRIFQVGEFIGSEDEGKAVIKPNILYRWSPGKDIIVKHTESLRFFEDLSRHTGMSINEINNDLTNKKFILDWLVKKKIRNIQEVGKIMNDYYLNPASLEKQIKKRR